MSNLLDTSAHALYRLERQRDEQSQDKFDETMSIETVLLGFAVAIVLLLLIGIVLLVVRSHRRRKKRVDGKDALGTQITDETTQNRAIQSQTPARHVALAQLNSKFHVPITANSSVPHLMSNLDDLVNSTPYSEYPNASPLQKSRSDAPATRENPKLAVPGVFHSESPSRQSSPPEGPIRSEMREPRLITAIDANRSDPTEFPNNNAQKPLPRLPSIKSVMVRDIEHPRLGHRESSRDIHVKSTGLDQQSKSTLSTMAEVPNTGSNTVDAIATDDLPPITSSRASRTSPPSAVYWERETDRIDAVLANLQFAEPKYAKNAGSKRRPEPKSSATRQKSCLRTAQVSQDNDNESSLKKTADEHLERRTPRSQHDGDTKTALNAQQLDRWVSQRLRMKPEICGQARLALAVRPNGASLCSAHRDSMEVTSNIRRARSIKHKSSVNEHSEGSLIARNLQTPWQNSYHRLKVQDLGTNAAGSFLASTSNHDKNKFHADCVLNPYDVVPLLPLMPRLSHGRALDLEGLQISRIIHEDFGSGKTEAEGKSAFSIVLPVLRRTDNVSSSNLRPAAITLQSRADPVEEDSLWSMLQAGVDLQQHISRSNSSAFDNSRPFTANSPKSLRSPSSKKLQSAMRSPTQEVLKFYCMKPSKDRRSSGLNGQASTMEPLPSLFPSPSVARRMRPSDPSSLEEAPSRIAQPQERDTDQLSIDVDTVGSRERHGSLASFPATSSLSANRFDHGCFPIYTQKSFVLRTNNDDLDEPKAVQSQPHHLPQTIYTLGRKLSGRRLTSASAHDIESDGGDEANMGDAQGSQDRISKIFTIDEEMESSGCDHDRGVVQTIDANPIGRRNSIPSIKTYYTRKADLMRTGRNVSASGPTPQSLYDAKGFLRCDC